jgi:hypothetical protein
MVWDGVKIAGTFREISSLCGFYRPEQGDAMTPTTTPTATPTAILAATLAPAPTMTLKTTLKTTLAATLGGLLAVSTLLGPTSAHALPQDDSARVIDLDKITWGGTGCTGRGEPLSFYYSKRLGRLYVSLPEVAVSTGEKPLDRKACSLALPVELPPGKALVIGNPAVYGEGVVIGQSAEGRVQGEVFIAGGQGPTVMRIMNAADGRIRPSFYSRENQTIEMACGGSGTVRLNVSALAKASAAGSGERASVTLDGAAFTLQLRDCR